MLDWCNIDVRLMLDWWYIYGILMLDWFCLFALVVLRGCFILQCRGTNPTLEHACKVIARIRFPSLVWSLSVFQNLNFKVYIHINIYTYIYTYVFMYICKRASRNFCWSILDKPLYSFWRSGRCLMLRLKRPYLLAYSLASSFSDLVAFFTITDPEAEWHEDEWVWRSQICLRYTHRWLI